MQFGEQILALRRRELAEFRNGSLPAGDEFAGLRIAVQIDGGRLRTRRNKPSRNKRKKGERQKFETPWREPKALVILAFDERGKMVSRHRQPLIDGTLLGPDHTFVGLVAYQLHRLGAARAERVVFIADGARWIWDRINGIVKRAGIDAGHVQQVLDFCHAAHHISLALSGPRRCRPRTEKRILPAPQAVEGGTLARGGLGVDCVGLRGTRPERRVDRDRLSAQPRPSRPTGLLTFSTRRPAVWQRCD